MTQQCLVLLDVRCLSLFIEYRCQYAMVYVSVIDHNRTGDLSFLILNINVKKCPNLSSLLIVSLILIFASNEINHTLKSWDIWKSFITFEHDKYYQIWWKYTQNLIWWPRQEWSNSRKELNISIFCFLNFRCISLHWKVLKNLIMSGIKL